MIGEEQRTAAAGMFMNVNAVTDVMMVVMLVVLTIFTYAMNGKVVAE
jgi:hypothetical protein